MILNIERLKKAGVTVRVYERHGKEHEIVDNLRDAFVEVFVENGQVPEMVVEAVKETLTTPEYRTVVTEGVIARIQQFQILEAIERTQD